MDKMENQLASEGYRVINVGYPSRHHNIETLSIMAIPEGIAGCSAQDASPIHFVTHSLGGILLRHYQQHSSIDQLSRVVMLGPPNQGSETVDKLKSLPGFGWLNGPAGAQLGTSPNDTPKTLGPVNFELGVIAGTRSINLLLSQFLPNPDDGKVSVSSTRVDGMQDHLLVPVSHPFLMKDERVIDQVKHFLKVGHFQHQ